jgi:DNA-binding MarR family transcriptional regulator
MTKRRATPQPGNARLRTANLLGALALEVTGRLQRQLRAHPNATDSSMAALNVLGFYDGCSNTALARALKLSHTATVRLVDKLEAAGLVEARPGDDRRATALHLTASGRARARALLQDRCAALGDVVDLLDPAEQALLARVAETMLARLTNSEAEADHICRLCDEIACPPDQCPVHQAALEKAA